MASGGAQQRLLDKNWRVGAMSGSQGVSRSGPLKKEWGQEVPGVAIHQMVENRS